MQEHDKIFIDGAWVPSTGKGTIDVFDSSNGEVFGRIPEGTADDVDKAAKAAHAAFPEWAAKTPEERAKFCTRISEGLGARMDEIATVVTREAGMPKWLSLIVQAGLPIASFATAAQVAESYEYETTVGNSLVVKEPVGVVGCITPWNYPLHQIAAKVAYALAAGCTVVLKPSEVAPLDAFILAEVVADAGVPAGVFNLVSGTGAEVGEAISRHPLIDMVSFTGSTRAGKAVAAAASENLKRVALELGGKSANILLDDLDDDGVREGRPRRRGQGLPQLGPDLHRPHADARPRGPAGRRRAVRGRRGRDPVPAQRPLRRVRHARPALQPGPGRPGHRLHPEGHRRGRQARHRRPRSAPRASTATS